MTPNNFNLDKVNDYQNWRSAKLNGYPQDISALVTTIEDPFALSQHEKASLAANLRKANLAIYKCTGSAMTKEAVLALSAQFGLQQLDSNICADEDSITSLQVQDTGRHGGYIPYTNKRLSWHTDGYYNPPKQQVRAIAMHCVRPAAQGGENQFLDPEILYIAIRDQNPQWIEALQSPDAMVIPANVENGVTIRGETRGPVFSVIPSGYLHMRYSARTRNIEWQQNDLIMQVTAFITEYLNSDSKFIFRYRLEANEGVISNNVLHNRSAFDDSEESGRLLYRARFYQRAES